MKRRRSVPERIVELLEDLKTLCGLSLKDWTIVVDDQEYDADPEVLKKVIITSPEDLDKDALVFVVAWNVFDDIKAKLVSRGHRGEILCMQ